MRENNPTVEDFLARLASKIQETNVLSTSLLLVLKEVDWYLDYCEDEIEKKIFFSVASERRRVQNEVFAQFAQDVSKGHDIHTLLGRLGLVNQVISRWDQFTREDIDTISRM